MSQTSNNLLHDPSYACMNGLMLNGMPSLSSNAMTNNGVSNQMTGISPKLPNKPASTTPYTMNDYINDINQKDGFESQNSNVVEDGVDDGKISFKSKIKNFGKGLISPIKNMIKHPIVSALGLAVGVGAIVATGGAITPLLIAAGVGMGAIKIGSGIYKQATAKTDAQAESAWQSIGSGTTDIGLSVLGSKKALKTSGTTPNGGFIKSTIQCFKEIPNSIKNSYSTIKNGGVLANIKSVLSRFNFKKKGGAEPKNIENETVENEIKIEKPKQDQSHKMGKTTTHKTKPNGDKVDTRYYDSKVKTQKTTTPDGDSIEIKCTKGERPSKITTKVNGHKTAETKIIYDSETYKELGRVTKNLENGEISYENLDKIQAGMNKNPSRIKIENPSIPKRASTKFQAKKPNNMTTKGKNVPLGTYKRFS